MVRKYASNDSLGVEREGEGGKREREIEREMFGDFYVLMLRPRRIPNAAFDSSPVE